MILNSYIKKLRQLAALGLLCIGLLPNGAVAVQSDIREYRVPNKQHVLLKKLGLEHIQLHTEAAKDVDRREAASTRRILYLPSNPGELAMGLSMLLDHAKQDDEGPESLTFMHSDGNRTTPPGYHADSGRLRATCDGKISKGPEHGCIEVDLEGWMQAYPQKLAVLSQEAWQAQWPGGTGLQFSMPEGLLHVYFPTRYSGLAPTADNREPSWAITRDDQTPERVPMLLGHKLHTTQMLHALASEGAPRLDALWVFYDSMIKQNKNNDHLYFYHDSHLRGCNQSNDYAHHQTLRWGTGLKSPEARAKFYTKMWAHMQQQSEPNLMEQLHALEAEQDVPYLRELEGDDQLDEKLWPEQPFTFRQMSLMQAYASMSLPMCAGDGTFGESKDGKRIESLWPIGEIYVNGGADLPVPDGLWDGRFKLFPHAHAHMINVGGLACNGERVPFLHLRDTYEHFRDGVHCGFAKKENIWWLKSGGKTIANLDEVAQLVQSVWDAPGRFYYEKVEAAPQPVPAPPLSEPEADRKPAARHTERQIRTEDMHPSVPPGEDHPEENGWLSSWLKWETNSTSTGATVEATSTAMAPFIAKNPKTAAAVSCVVTAALGKTYEYANYTRTSKKCVSLQGNLVFGFANDKDRKAITTTISCDGETIKAILSQEREDVSQLNVDQKSPYRIQGIYLFSLSKAHHGGIIIEEIESGKIHTTDWFGRVIQEERSLKSILKNMKKKVKEKRTSLWDWLPGVNNVSKAFPVGYILIGYFEPSDMLSRLSIKEKLHKLEDAIKDRLHEENPGSVIHSRNWSGSEEAKQSSYLDNIQIRIITTLGNIEWGPSNTTA